MTLVCVPITVRDEGGAITDAEASKRAGADLVELRVDEVFSGARGIGGGDSREVALVLRLVARSPLPCIVTCRLAREGGAYDGDEDARIALFERLGRAEATTVGPANAAEHPPRYIDVEWSAYARSANLRQKVHLAVAHPGALRDLQTGLLLSTHDFNGRPSDLLRRVADMARDPAAAVLKVAYRTRSLRDALELLELPAQLARPTIALGMGEFGFITRVLAPKFGGFLTFASLRESSATAPGQPTIADLLGAYRFRAINESTEVYGVVGWPIAHSLSPLVHNSGFAASGRNAVYLPLPVAAGDDREASYASFKGTMLDLIHHPRLDLRGCSVTIPHKENLLRLAREQSWEIDPVAEAVGAANTLSRGANRTPRIANTDVLALDACLREAVGELGGKRVAVLGAGGVARAAAYAGGLLGAHVRVHARTVMKAQALAGELAPRVPGAIEAAEWGSIGSEPADVIVQATTIGMEGGPAPGAAPVPADAWSVLGRAAVIETVYRPALTPLLREALSRGLPVIDGISIFARQAEAQFQVWTGSPPPSGLFESLARPASSREAQR